MATCVCAVGRTRPASRNAARLRLRRGKSSRKLFKWRARVVLLESEPMRLRLRAELVTLAESRGEPGEYGAFNIPRISSGFGTRVCDESSLEARPREGRTTGRISTIDHAPALGLTLTLLARPRSRRVASTRPVLFRLSSLAPSTNLHCTHVAFSVRVRSNRFSLYRNDLASSCLSFFHRPVFSFLPSLRVVSSIPNRTRPFLRDLASLFSHRLSSYHRFYVSRAS